MVSVCIVGVYFGEFPNYFELWLKSAEMNSTIDFMIFTDQKYTQLPTNVKLVNMNIKTMKELAENKLKFKISLERPYKCCDFKPAYGLIFEDYLQQYDYWGHCDFDLIWGDLRYFIQKFELQKYEKFLSLGHLSLYRNTARNKKCFMLAGSSVGDYKKVFQDEHNFAFDELDGIYNIYIENNIPMFSERIFADISKIYKRFKLALNDINYDHQIFYWKDGHIYRAFKKDNEILIDEFMYIHFKERGVMRINNINSNSCMFFITPFGFVGSEDGIISLNIIDDMNPFLGKTYEDEELKAYVYSEKKRLIKSKLKKLFHLKERIR